MRTRGQKRKIIEEAKNDALPANHIGYTIFRRAFSEYDLPRDIHDLINTASPIFNTAKKNDRLRRQVQNIDDHRFIRQRFMPWLQLLFPELTPNTPVLLVSMAGCQEQVAHTDFDPEDIKHLPGGLVPMSALLALQDDTGLNIWSGSHRNTSSTKKTLLLEAGDVCVFRGDLVHCGAAYDKQNVRIHAYIDNDLVPRDLGKTYRIDDEEIKKRLGLS